MESQSRSGATHEKEFLREVGNAEEVWCKCGEGWTCVITRTVGPDAGKVFFECGENCACSMDGEEVKKEESKISGAYCKCGEGWSCVISKIEAPEDRTKGFECQGSCTCTVHA